MIIYMVIHYPMALRFHRCHGDRGDPCSMPTWIGVKQCSEAAPPVIQTDLSDRYDCTQSTRYGRKLLLVIISASHWCSTLSKTP